jgi:hypothetical protein
VEEQAPAHEERQRGQDQVQCATAGAGSRHAAMRQPGQAEVQPACEEANPGPERERRVVELGGVLRPHRAEPSVRIGGQAGGDSGQEKGQPQGVAREAGRRADQRVHAGPEDDADPGHKDLPETERSPQRRGRGRTVLGDWTRRSRYVHVDPPDRSTHAANVRAQSGEQR